MTNKNVYQEIRLRLHCLQEALTSSYSKEYRLFRLKEALGINPDPEEKK